MGGANFHPESDEQTGNRGGGQGVRVQGNRQRQGRAKQRNETYLTYILAHFTRTVVIKAQGASTSYFFFNKVVQNNTFYSLYKNNDPAEKSKDRPKARLKGRRGSRRGGRGERESERLGHPLDVLLMSRVITRSYPRSDEVPTCQCTRFFAAGRRQTERKIKGRRKNEREREE